MNKSDSQTQYVIGVVVLEDTTFVSYCSMEDLERAVFLFSIPSVVAIDDYYVCIGEEALHSGLKTISGFFREPKNIDGEKEIAITEFFFKLYEEIRQKLYHILTDKNHHICVSIPDSWGTKGIALFEIILRNAVKIDGMTFSFSKVSRAASFDSSSISQGLSELVRADIRTEKDWNIVLLDLDQLSDSLKMKLKDSYENRQRRAFEELCAAPVKFRDDDNDNSLNFLKTQIYNVFEQVCETHWYEITQLLNSKFSAIYNIIEECSHLYYYKKEIDNKEVLYKQIHCDKIESVDECLLECSSFAASNDAWIRFFNADPNEYLAKDLKKERRRQVINTVFKKYWETIKSTYMTIVKKNNEENNTFIIKQCHEIKTYYLQIMSEIRIFKS